MRRRFGVFSLKKLHILIVLVVILIVVFFFVAYKLLYNWEFSDDHTTSASQPKETLAADSALEERPMISYNGGWYALREDLETLLLLGVDKYEKELSDQTVYRNQQQTDFVMLLVMDKKQNSYTAIHLNRDTMTKIPILSVNGMVVGYENAQLTLAHTYGSGGADSCRNSVRAVSEFLYGIDVKHYIALTMDAVAVLNDAVGGVTVTLEDDFSFLDPEMTAGKTVTLKGNEALAYVRARGEMEDSSNLARMKRQQTYLYALYGALQSKAGTDSEFLLETIVKISEHMVSDCTVEQLNDIAELTKNSEFLGIENTPGEAMKGERFMEFYADDNALSELVIELFYEPIALN